jgi:hypothetical protein
MKALIQHGHIGVVCAAVVLLVSVILFHDNEGAMTAATAIAFVVCFGVFSFLNGRDDRTNPRDKSSD